MSSRMPTTEPGSAAESIAFLRLPEVKRITGLSRSQIYRLEALGQFPRHVKLGPATSAWISTEIAQWQTARIALRDAGRAP